MRCFQLMGLTAEARKFLKDNCEQEVSLHCPRCNHPLTIGYKTISVRHIDSFYGDGPDLHTYEMKGGKTVKEVIQAEVWSGGPVCFLCLKLENGTRIGEWPREAIDNA